MIPSPHPPDIFMTSHSITERHMCLICVHPHLVNIEPCHYVDVAEFPVSLALSLLIFLILPVPAGEEPLKIMI